jgi:hypothetical protein
VCDSLLHEALSISRPKKCVTGGYKKLCEDIDLNCV